MAFSALGIGLCKIHQYEMAIASVDSPYKLELYNLQTKALLSTYTIADTKKFTAFAHNKDVIVTGEANRKRGDEKNPTNVPAELIKIWSRSSGRCLRACTASNSKLSRYSFGETNNYITGIHLLNSYDFVTHTGWNKKIKRWQFNTGRTPIKVLVIPSKGPDKLLERQVNACHLIALAAGKHRFPALITSRVVRERENFRHHLIFQYGQKPEDGNNVNQHAAAFATKILLSAKNYAKNAFAGYWIGDPEELSSFAFEERTTSSKAILGKAVLVRERKTQLGSWEFCDCETERWITETIKSVPSI